MKIAITLKNTSRGLKPTHNDVILFDKDANEWYVTTKKDLLKESEELLEKCKNELVELKKENEDFKVNVAKQLVEMSTALERILKER